MSARHTSHAAELSAHPEASAAPAAAEALLEERVASVFVLLYQHLRQYLYFSISQPGDGGGGGNGITTTGGARFLQ